MDFDKLLKNDYVRLALLAVVAYLAYHYLVVVREGNQPGSIGIPGSCPSTITCNCGVPSSKVHPCCREYCNNPKQKDPTPPIPQ